MHRLERPVDGEIVHLLALLQGTLDPAEGTAMRIEFGAGKLKPSFIWMLRAPPSAFRPKAGLLVIRSTDSIAAVGIRSQFMASPKASLMRTPFW